MVNRSVLFGKLHRICHLSLSDFLSSVMQIQNRADAGSISAMCESGGVRSFDIDMNTSSLSLLVNKGTERKWTLFGGYLQFTIARYYMVITHSTLG